MSKTILSQIMTRFTSHACHAFLSDGDTLPLSQPQSAHGTLVGGSSCPGTPEMRRRQEEVLRRLASQVPTNTNIISQISSLPFNLILYRFIISVSPFLPLSPSSFINLLLVSLALSLSLSLSVLSLSLYSFKHKGLLQLCCLIKYLYAQSLPAQPLNILRVCIANDDKLLNRHTHTHTHTHTYTAWWSESREAAVLKYWNKAIDALKLHNVLCINSSHQNSWALSFSSFNIHCVFGAESSPCTKSLRLEIRLCLFCLFLCLDVLGTFTLLNVVFDIHTGVVPGNEQA